ncbi:MAG: deoxyguanosinetriphosphate triphosphohydrolase [Coriobacteriia bacterium]|nr:deoxyguanosinetriphosphate triphosphohydrolase [Coriobacteriia bacterium]
MGETSIITREAYEIAEAQWLSPRAALASGSIGRERPTGADLYRTCFQRDRDRVLHCKAFRRLSHKTQVFLAPEGDHYRTRLTHTLEVAQIARSIARALRLNEDLTEAIALGHDLGHTPFGHIGESALDDALKAADPGNVDTPRRFRHNLQSLRIVEQLEYEGKGLNLTWEVRDGIACHTGKKRASTLEGQIVAIADRIAYVNHDIDDALRGGVITQGDIPAAPIAVLGTTINERITTMVTSLVETTAVSETVEMSADIYKAMMDLRSFLYDYVYLSPNAKAEEPKAYNVVRTLFDHYIATPDDLPPDERPERPEDLTRAVTDYVSGMTDRFAIRTYEQLMIPSRWRV